MLARKLSPAVSFVYAEVVQNGCADVGKRVSSAEVYALFDVFSAHYHRHVFARMVCGRRGRITTVIGGDNQQIVVAHIRQKLSELHVKFRHCVCISRNIVAMTVLHIEVDEIDKAKSLEISFLDVERNFHSVCIRRRAVGFAHALACKIS